jgi:hypothetical protein
MGLISVRIDELIFDESIYPRKTVNTTHVRALADAVTTGSKLPPIIIDQTSHSDSNLAEGRREAHPAKAQHVATGRYEFNAATGRSERERAGHVLGEPHSAVE